MTKKFKIMIVATERTPYASVGGIGSVIDYLSKALVRLGHDVYVFMPKFGTIDEGKYPMEMAYKGLKVTTGSKVTPELITNVKKIESKDAGTTYFLENLEYFEKRANVYGYADDPTRFMLLCKGAIEFIKQTDLDIDIIHCNDWHTGYLPNLLKTEYLDDKKMGKIPTVFTVHNLSYQGVFDYSNVTEMNYDDGKSRLLDFFHEKLVWQNAMKRGIIYSDIVNTVSKTYAREMLTAKFGEGLDKLLLELQEKLYGVVNGLDYTDFDPKTDSRIHKNYDVDSLEDRAANKDKLQAEFGLPRDEDALIIGFVGRLAHMKGLDMGISVLRRILKRYNVQFVQIGGGDKHIQDMLMDLKNDFPDKVGVHPSPNFTLPRLLFAGSDCVLYPSRFEPCGIVQIEALRYGSVPIVRNVGGLADTVSNFDRETKKGNGFVFNDFDEFDLYGEIVRAIETFKDKSLWKTIQKNGMNSNFSWDASALEYAKLYELAKSRHGVVGPTEKAFGRIYG